MIIGLISMPVTSITPKRRCDRTSRPPPTPITAPAFRFDSIGEVAHVIAQELQTREVSIEAIYAAARAAVDRQRSLLDRRARQARRRPPHRWWACFAVSDSDAGKRIPAIIGKIGRRFQVVLDDRGTNAVDRERVGHRKE